MGKELSDRNLNVELAAINRGAPDVGRERRDQQAEQAPLPWQRALSR